MPFSPVVASSEVEVEYLKSRYPHSVYSAIPNVDDFTLMATKRQVEAMQEELEPVAEEDIHIFKSFMIRFHVEEDGTRMVDEAWGLSQDIPWPYTYAFKLL